MAKIVLEQIAPLAPVTAKEFFHNRGTIYECIDIMWSALQKRAAILNHVLKAVDDQLVANDLAALEAENAGKTAMAVATKVADEAASSIGSHILAVDKKIAEINALKIIFESNIHETENYVALIKQMLERGELNGKDGKDGKNGKDGADGQDGKTPVKGVDYFDGVDGKNGTDGRDGRDGRDGLNGQDGRDGQDGQDGAPGKSAYELWLEEGNTGSLGDMLASILSNAGIDDKLSSMIADKVDSSTGGFETRIAALEAYINNNPNPNPPSEDDPIVPTPDDDDGDYPDFGEITDDNAESDMEI